MCCAMTHFPYSVVLVYLRSDRVWLGTGKRLTNKKPFVSPPGETPIRDACF